LQEKLKLPKDQGLLVDSVEPKSPAATAGIQAGDVLLKANAKPLRDLRDLMKLINEVKDGKLTLELLRNGKRETVVATPAKRPTGDTAEARAWIENLRSKIVPGRDLQLHIVGPGQIVPFNGAETPGIATTKVEVTIHTKATLGDGSQVEITREGGKPAKVVVTREKDRWAGTSDDLSKIPEKVRPEVERLLHSPMDHVRFFASPAGPAQGNVFYFGGAAPMLGGAPGTMATGPGVEKRLREMQNQIDELKQQVKALQDNAKPKQE
jgi:hypothetical protein